MVAAFALAPDGRSVAYAWDRQILVSDLDRNGRRSLVRPGGDQPGHVTAAASRS